MNEAETRAELIDPKLHAAGWGVVEGSRIRREVIAPGRVGDRARKPDIADYVLIYRNTKLAVIEAKRRDLPDTEGVEQAKKYADKLQARFAFSTNGLGVYRIDMANGAEGYVENWPGPEELWALVYPQANLWRDRFAVVPFVEKGADWTVRYYQANAINNVLARVADGGRRALLTLATGTGKTSIAFQIAWKLFAAKWNLSDAPTRSPRILFLADRNNLADQAFNDFSSFAAFDDSGLVRISPDEIARTGRAPKNGAVFFTIFQTFMSGRDAMGEPAPNYGDYPPDFFDAIFIDECHRGGAKDESEWRRILDYFAPALKIGLTATPKRKWNADTYAYFGEPVYIYSLKDGISDGYLTPFKVKQIATTIDEYVYTPDDDVIEGAPEEGKRYRESDFNRNIEIREREKYRVRLFMDMIDQNEKTIVFCASQLHALFVRDLINQIKKNPDPHYCARVTANDGKIGDNNLRDFRNNERTIPTILTTSQKLSTGVDARNVRNIVLMRPVHSIIEFKQIVGRGTRLYEGKNYFTIYDFVKAYEHFNDAEWDGEPLEPEAPPEPRPRPQGMEECEQTPYTGGEEEDAPRPTKLKIRLADGKERQIQHMVGTIYTGASGGVISAAQFVEQLFGALPALFRDEDELRKLWSHPETRRALLDGLAEAGFGDGQLEDIRAIVDADKSDLYDVLAYIAFARAPLTRAERADAGRQGVAAEYDDRLRDFLDFVLGEYVKVGEVELDPAKLAELVTLKYGSVGDAQKAFGGMAPIREAFLGFQRYIYETRR